MSGSGLYEWSVNLQLGPWWDTCASLKNYEICESSMTDLPQFMFSREAAFEIFLANKNFFENYVKYISYGTVAPGV